MSRRRVLLIAEACNPEMVSVPLEGWSHTQAVARRVGAHLVTQVRNRAAIERAGLVHGRDFTAIDSEAVARRVGDVARLLRGGTTRGWTFTAAAGAISYPYFERLLWEQFGPRLRAGEFDLVHRVTPLSPTIPSPIAPKLKEISVPFVWGPINGGVPWPKGFDEARRFEREWLSYVRDVYRFLPGYRATRGCASAILVGSRDTLAQVPRSYHDRCVYVPENAIDPNRFTKRRTRRATPPLKLVFVGRLVPYKGPDMLVEAIAPLVSAGKVTLDVIGNGPMMDRLATMVNTFKLRDGVRLRGWVKHQELQDWLIDSDLFAFPSVREFGGAVALEAMAVGLPPMVVEYGGPAELVTPDTGFLVPIGSRQQIVANVRDVVSRLCDDPSQIDVRSEPAYRRAHEQFTWDAKAAQVVDVYERVLADA
jgi:glycosyltransferase involved in cell wall biosynthesis